MGRIPEHILEEVLSRTDIVELVSSVIPLKKAGRNFKACCPFHQEKTPSFVVSPEKQIYHCFGCGESGNAIGFLMRYERMEFLEALRTLAQKAGIPLPDTRRASGEQEQLSSKLYKVNEIAASFYAGVLRSAAGERARAYVRSRGISDETARVF
ncbi:MAG: CHC2 zinc finger domain-containing protein, partial [Candidatus Omnitrophica bacterium]|nr:CHC2 zinc finger domain-containing protein [Candidatus Omnitrophota bacterium]